MIYPYDNSPQYNTSTDSLRKALRNIDIEVLDIHKVDNRMNYHTDYFIGDSQPMQTQIAPEQTQVEWDVRMDNDKIIAFVEADEALRYYKDMTVILDLKYKKAASNVQSYEHKFGEMRQVLNDNPQIKQQMKEIMVLLKMAGLDSDVAKLIT
jgi:hypothetical protein